MSKFLPLLNSFRPCYTVRNIFSNFLAMPLRDKLLKNCTVQQELFCIFQLLEVLHEVQLRIIFQKELRQMETPLHSAPPPLATSVEIWRKLFQERMNTFFLSFRTCSPQPTQTKKGSKVLRSQCSVTLKLGSMQCYIFKRRETSYWENCAIQRGH